ncbi:MAG: AmmeMemoRadiSam system protein A, partial [Sulfurimonas sp.]
PKLLEDGATFVTLHYQKQLRGCIGSVLAHTSILEDIINNAQSAAFSDPRFTPLDVSELDELDIEVSVLTAPEHVEYNDFDDLLTKIVPEKDGLILQKASYQGTFLPQVWEELPSVEKFLEHLSYKAGADPSIFEKHPGIYRYRVEAIEEPYNEVLSL